MSRVAILNGFGRTLGDGIIGLQALRVAMRCGVVTRPVLFRLPDLPPMVDAVHQAARFAAIQTLPWEFATRDSMVAVAGFDRVIDIRDFAFDADFQCCPTIDFFLRRLGVAPESVPAAERRNAWLAEHVQPEKPDLPEGYALICPRASMALRDMPEEVHAHILRRVSGPVVSQAELPLCATLAELCGLVRYARLVVSTDTAMVHLADAFDVRCLGFFPTHRPDWRVRDYPRCVPVALKSALPPGIEFARGPEDDALAHAAWFAEGGDLRWLDRVLERFT